ncbi:MAG: T9SS type A sorting domain-containing protein [Flavobacteriales bacterium]|nr:T9SS type A sorting domain-containing protein [Flavobacteriales bacterium]
MKKTLLSIFACSIAFSSMAQQTTQNWDFDGTNRQYIQYVPSIYDGSEAVPLVIVLHGLGDNMGNMAQVGFRQVADTANFIVVTPEALIDQMFTGSTAWNSGAGVAGFSLNANVDDLGFINALIDTVSTHYNIDQSRVFATGFSMGAFMSNRLACELNNRIASIASVAGTIGGTLTCAPGQDVPVCHFHGTSDTQVGYGTAGGGVQDNSFGNNVVDWISFWNTNNGCGNVTLEGQFPNSANDGFTVDYVEYAGCDNNSRTVHYKVHGADHVWLGPSNDVFYTTEIWKFFLGLSPTNLVPAGIAENAIATIGIYPNPTSDILRIENTEAKILNVSVFNTAGQLVKEFSSASNAIDVSNLETGVYQLMVATEKGLFSNSFVLSR